MRLMSRYRNKVIEIGMNILVVVRSLVDSPACGFYQLVKFRILHKVKDRFINWMYKSNVFVPIMQGKGTKMLPNYVFFNNVEDCWRGHKKAPKIFVLGAF
jgi:hypothetical protein